MNQDTDLQVSDEISSRFLILLLLVAALGFAAHRLRPVIQRLGVAWTELTSYAIGGAMIIAVFPMIFSMVLGSADPRENNARKRAVFLGFLSLVLSLGSVGAGVALGWLIDPDLAGGND